MTVLDIPKDYINKHHNYEDYWIKCLRDLTPDLFEKYIGIDYMSKNLNVKKAPGLDYVSNRMIKSSCDLLAPSICALFNKCLGLHYFPYDWKCAGVRVIPKPNKNDYDDTKSYRPISLISNLAKIFEKILKIKVYDQFCHLLNPNQHGFVKNKSTSSALSSITSTALLYKSTMKTAIIALDIASAFDKAWWPAIIFELDKANVPANLILLLKSYLSERSIIFNYGNYSASKSLSCGCPQGGALSPLLWIILLNDLLCKYNIVDSKLIAFADDLTIVCWATNTRLLNSKIIL